MTPDVRRTLDDALAYPVFQDRVNRHLRALESPARIAGKTAGFDQPGREHTVGDALGLRRGR